MRNPQCYVSGKRPMPLLQITDWKCFGDFDVNLCFAVDASASHQQSCFSTMQAKPLLPSMGLCSKIYICKYILLFRVLIHRCLWYNWFDGPPFSCVWCNSETECWTFTTKAQENVAVVTNLHTLPLAFCSILFRCNIAYLQNVIEKKTFQPTIAS